MSLRLDILTPITLKTRSQNEQAKVLPFPGAVVNVQPVEPEQTQLDLDRHQEPATDQLIEFLEKRKAKRQKEKSNKLKSYNNWIQIFKNQGDPQQGLKLYKKI